MKRLSLLSLCAAGLLGSASPAFAQNETLAGGPFEAPAEAAQAEPSAPVSLAPAPEAAPAPAVAPVAAAATQAAWSPAVRAPHLVRTSPYFSHRIGMGDYCIDAQGGLQEQGESRVPALILWRCDGLENQGAALIDGTLSFGWRFQHYVRPARAPLDGCTDIDARSTRKAYRFRVCAGEGVTAVSATPELTMVTVYAPAGQLALTRGAPLFVDHITPGSGPTNLMAYNRDAGMLSTADGALCAMPPPGDVTTDAPLYLDSCSAPAAANPRDARRGQVRFLQD